MSFSSFFSAILRFKEFPPFTVRVFSDRLSRKTILLSSFPFDSLYKSFLRTADFAAEKLFTALFAFVSQGNKNKETKDALKIALFASP